MSKINIVVAAQTGSAIKGLDNVTRATQRTGDSVRKAQGNLKAFGGSMEAARIRTRKFAMGGLQQAGYQIGDYAVQVANGTSKMQAFGQQAPQLLQIFGPIGSVIGAGVAILSAFAVALDRTREAAKEAEIEVVTFGNAVGRLEQIDTINLAENLSAPAKAAMSEYSALLDLMQGVAEEQRVAALSKFAEGIAPSEGIAQLQRQLEIARSNASMLSQAVIDANENIANAAKSNESRILGQLTAQKTLRDIILSIQGKTRDEASRSLSTAIESLNSAGLMTSELRAQIQAFAEQNGLISAVAEKAEDLTSATRGSADAAKVLGDRLTYDDGVMRALRLKASDMAVLYRQMVGTHAQRLQMLRDEDLVMAQLVTKSIIYGKSDLKGGRSAGPGGAMKSDATKEFERQLEAQEDWAKLQESLRSANTSTASSVVKLSGTIDQELTPAMERLKSIQDSVGQSFENAMMSAVDGTKSVKDAFKSMASEIIKELYRVFVVKRITGFISSAVGGYFNMNQVSGPSMPFGTGSVRPMGRPSSFSGGGYTGSGARAGGMDGKGGFMAMVHPRETIVDHTRGQGAGGVVVNQTINVSTGVQQTVRTEIRTLMPQIAEAAKSAVADARLRGGSYGRSFA